MNLLHQFRAPLLAQVSTADGQEFRALQVDTADADEAAAAGELETAQVNYSQALKVLAAYYRKVGNLPNQTNAEQELANLEEAQWFKITGLPAPTAAPQPRAPRPRR